MNHNQFWLNKRVFITGHTGFKGSWLSLWLQNLGADVIGFALHPPTKPSLFEVADVGRNMQSIRGDIRDAALITKAMQKARPEIVIHMAAQPLVRHSYINPIETYNTNIMGSVHVFEAVRQTPSVSVMINVTSDKCYENKEKRTQGYQETDSMGGYDPYSSSKGCVELITNAYRNSFFNLANYLEHGVSIASVRAGNVIGGGDWAVDRLVPDVIRSIQTAQPVKIRSPHAIRPWQHVLEPLHGYLLLAEKLYKRTSNFSGAWNFGANEEDTKTVFWIVKYLTLLWGNEAKWELNTEAQPYEATYLKLDCSKAKTKLGWSPRWSLKDSLLNIVKWHKAHFNGEDMRDVTLHQIESFSELKQPVFD